MSAFVEALDAAGGGLDRLGGKAESLARLARAGFPVPAGFCVTTAAYRAAVAQPDLAAALADAGGSEADVRAAFAAAPLPTGLEAELDEAYRALGEPPVAVRSSATAEDLPGLSFAGQQDTFLNVTGAEELRAAVRACWASLGTARAVAYRAARGVAEDAVAMAVVVQRLVPAEAAGILFTADPATGDESVVTINGAWGLGEAVVGGQVTPDTFSVERDSGRLERQTVADKAVMTVRTATGTTEQPVPAELRSRPCLTPAQAERLAGLGVRIAALYGRPMDVEWCRVEDTLSVLQARPVTGLRPDPWNDSRTGRFLWTNTNVGEAIPDVMTPATWSMVQVFLTDAMATASIAPYVGYGRIGGRIYLNVSVMARLSRAVGVSEHRYRNLTEEVFGTIPDDVEIPPVEASPLKILRAVVPMGVHVVREARRDVKVLDRYLAGHPALCERRRAQIARVTSAGGLARLWTDRLDPEFHRVSLMLSAATRSSGASFVTTRVRLQRLVGPAAANALTAGLGSEAGQLASLGLLDGLEQLAAGTIDADTFRRRYGHRGPHEFELSTPRPGEDPHWVDDQLAQARGSRTYRALLEAQEQARTEAWAELERRHPRRAVLLRRQLTRWAKISRDRERARTEVIRYFWVLRDFVRKAGELTGLGDDIFFLEGPEIQRLLSGEVLPPGLVAPRRAAYEAYRTLPPYPVLISGRFDPYAWAADPQRRSDLYVEGQRAEAATTVRGFPGSAGVVEGVVRVLHDADDGAALQPGEVLVTTVTNVGWTPLFPRAAAVVTDVGAPLSHAAIVARELGIPAVVGCGNATMRLATGDRVLVDGTAGTVSLLP